MRTTRSQQSREMPHGQTEQTDSQSYPDAGAVILDLDELQTTFLHRHLDISRLCIQTAKKINIQRPLLVSASRHLPICWPQLCPWDWFLTRLGYSFKFYFKKLYWHEKQTNINIVKAGEQ